MFGGADLKKQEYLYFHLEQLCLILTTTKYFEKPHTIAHASLYSEAQTKQFLSLG